MSMIGMIIMWVFVAIAVAVAVLYNCDRTMEKKYKRRKAYWSKFEDK